MTQAPKTTSKTPAPAPFSNRQSKASGPSNPLFEARPKTFGIGQSVRPRTNLSRYIKWPQMVRIQRQRKVLNLRLKVPPAISQFRTVLDKNTASLAFKLLNNYRPETAAEKKERLVKEAAAVAEGKKKEDVSEKPYVVKYGLNHVTSLIENKKPKLVLIANDVDPIELVIFLPALCRKMGVPFAIVKGKSRLGTLVHKKQAAVVALTDVRSEDEAALSNLLSAIQASWLPSYEDNRRKWGGGIMGFKAQQKERKKREAIANALTV